MLHSQPVGIVAAKVVQCLSSSCSEQDAEGTELLGSLIVGGGGLDRCSILPSYLATHILSNS